MKISQKDIFTYANITSLLGLAVVINGAIHLNTLIGVIYVMGGRGLDIVDGHIARKTHASAFGAAVDATFDKLAIAVILFAAAWHELVWWPLLAFIAIQNIFNATLATTAYFKGTALESSNLGKKTVFMQGGSLALILISPYIPVEWLSFSSGFSGYAIGLASVPVSIMASAGYARRFGTLNNKHKRMSGI